MSLQSAVAPPEFAAPTAGVIQDLRPAGLHGRSPFSDFNGSDVAVLPEATTLAFLAALLFGLLAYAWGTRR
ncbi:MAG: hypothetical protein WCB27_26730 [Thermoguttaceae bacterium]